MGKSKRYLILLVLSIGAVAIYFMPYLRWTFYDSLYEAVGLSNAQFAATLSIYGVTSMIFYAPGGYLADKFSPRKMLAFAYAATGLLGLWYATYPGFVAQMVIFALWGIIGTAFFWSSMLKVTNSLGSEEEQGRMFGLLEGGRGVINVVVAFIALFVYGKLGESVGGVTAILIGTCVLCFISSLLIWFIVPDKLNGSSGDKIKVKDIGKVLKLPAVWIIAVIVLSCYSVYIGSTYLTPYMTEVLGVGASVAAAIAIVRSYVLQFVAGPTGGMIADKIGSVPKVITACFILMVVALAAFCLLPATHAMATVAVIMMLLFCVGIFAMRGIYFAPVGQSNIPSSLVGTAIGVISVIGFFPDVYMNALVGTLMDTFPGVQGYKYTFFIMLAFAVIGLVA
ncbi:MAG: nitrate/nitrite transporter, partial [Clostridia bacterium]